MGGRFYGFARCFYNVSRRPAASSVRAAPCQLPQWGSFYTVPVGDSIHPHRLYSKRIWRQIAAAAPVFLMATPFGRYGSFLVALITLNIGILDHKNKK